MEEAGKVVAGSAFLLAGYIYSRTSYVSRFRSLHLRADRYALHILGWALLCYVGGDFLASLIRDWTPSYFVAVRDDALKVGVSAAVVNAVLVALFLAFVANLRVLWSKRNYPLIKNTPAWRKLVELFALLRFAGLVYFIENSDDANLQVIFRAVSLQKQVMITLKSRKVYVGDPARTEIEPGKALTSIKILPFASGSRDEVTKKVHLSTVYSSLIESLTPIAEDQEPEEQTAPLLRADVFTLPMPWRGSGVTAEIDIEDFGVVIAWSDVESLTIFDADIWDWFQHQEPAQLPSRRFRPSSMRQGVRAS